MARVTAYETSDGQLLRDRKQYLRHEANLIVAAKLAEMLPGAVRAKLGEAAPQEVVDAKVAEIQDVVVNRIGLNVVRDLMEIKFKPTDGEGDGEAGAAPAADAAATPASAPAAAPAAGSDDAAI